MKHYYKNVFRNFLRVSALTALVLCALGFPKAFAWIVEANTAGVVRAFDPERVQVVINNKVVTVPRSSILRENLKVGDLVLVRLTNQQVRLLFPNSSQKRNPSKVN